MQLKHFLIRRARYMDKYYKKEFYLFLKVLLYITIATALSWAACFRPYSDPNPVLDAIMMTPIVVTSSLWIITLGCTIISYIQAKKHKEL